MVEFQEFLQSVKKRLMMILVITLAAAATSATISYFVIKPTYKSDISVIIGKVNTDPNNKTVYYSDFVMYQMLVKTYSELAKSRTVAENVIESLKLDIKPEVLQKMISVAPKSDTEFLTITVKSDNPEQAMLIANQFAKSLKAVSIVVNNMDNVQVLDPAQFPTSPDSPKPILNMAVAFLLGFMGSSGLAFLLEYLDNTVKAQDDIEKLIGIPVVGMIPYGEKSD